MEDHLELLVTRVEATSLRAVLPDEADIPRVRDVVKIWNSYLDMGKTLPPWLLHAVRSLGQALQHVYDI